MRSTSYKKRAEISSVKKSISRLKEMIFLTCQNGNRALIEDDTDIHSKSFQDNISSGEELPRPAIAEILSDQLNIYHTTIAAKLNDTMEIPTSFQ